jgi:hypothetical protein
MEASSDYQTGIKGKPMHFSKVYKATYPEFSRQTQQGGIYVAGD